MTALTQGLAPALSDGSRLSWAAPSSLHEGLGYRALFPDRIQGDAAKPRLDKAQSRITFARPGRRSLRPECASFAPRSPPSGPLRAASGGDLRSGLTAAARGACEIPCSGRRNALRSNKETQQPCNPALDTKAHTRTRRTFGAPSGGMTVGGQPGWLLTRFGSMKPENGGVGVGRTCCPGILSPSATARAPPCGIRARRTWSPAPPWRTKETIAVGS